MTPLFPAQSAAEEFDQVLAGTADAAVTARYAELLDTLEQLRALPEVSPRAEFVGDLRSRLMTAAETELVAVPAAPSAVPSLPEERARRRNRRLGTLAASLVVVGGSAGMAAAASGALPGDGLYPVKRGIEQVTTAARFSDAGEGKALLDQAGERLDEVRALEAQGSADPDLIAETVDSFRSAADAGSTKLFTSYRATGDESDISTVRDFTAAQMADVADMSASADSETNDLLVDVADTLADIDQEAMFLCASCDPGSALAPPANLSAGAAAVSMNNLIARPVTQAQSDIDAEAARLAALQDRAEQRAGEIPQVPAGAEPPNADLPGTAGQTREPLTSAITPDGKLVPSITSDAAVDDLVSGVTGPVDEATGGATGPVTKPLDDAVDKLGDTADDLLP
jgi:Domain of unknown function (DUF5667)